MKIVLWNTNGITNKGGELSALLSHSNADACILTETWLRPGQRVPSNFSYWQTVDVPRPGRPAGGVAILLRPGLQAKLIRRYVSDGCNGVWLRITGGFDLIGLYVRPNCRSSDLQELLSDVHSRARAPFIMAGDFNSRHKDWCCKQNGNGSRLSAWAKAHNVTVNAPSQPTFVSARGRSTIDLFLSRSLVVDKPVVLNGVWNGASDHIPIQSIIRVSSQHSSSSFIPTRVLLSKENMQKARKRYESELPKLTARIHDALHAAEIEESYGAFVDVIISPWRSARPQSSRLAKTVWDAELRLLAKDRERLFRIARNSNTPDAWEEHPKVDRRIKRTVSRKNRARVRQQIKSLMEVSTAKAQQWLSRVMRKSSSAARVDCQDGLPLSPKEFTAHMETRPGETTLVPPRKFVPPVDMAEKLLSAINALPNGSAPGPDGIYYEMLKAAPREVAQLLNALWKKCGELAYTPVMWNRGTLVPIWKKGDPQLPNSYRPICLLSTGRKVIERALVQMLDESFTPNCMQLGFQTHLGAEMAISQVLSDIKSGSKWIAVLDLKSAYDRVRRDRLLELCDNILPAELTAMVSHLLQPLIVRTEGDTDRNLGTISRGVSQGGPASTKLFNIYINPLAERLDHIIPAPGSSSPAKLYADDVILLLRSLWQLIVALKVCEKWASENGMEWAVKPGKSELLFSKRNCAIVPSLPFAGRIIRSVKEAQYLGVILTASGISEGTACARIRNAHATLTRLRNAKLVTTGMNPKFALKVFQTLLQSQTDYGSFLSPCTAEARVAYNSLLCRFFGMTVGCRIKPSQLPRIRLLFQIPSQLLRRRILANKFFKRMKSLGERDNSERGSTQAKKTIEALPATHAGALVLDDPDRAELLLISEFDRAQSKKRRIPAVRKGALPPTLALSSYRLRKSAVKWHLGTFPRNYALLRRCGLERIIMHLQILEKPRPTAMEFRDIRIALRILTAIPEDLLV